MEKQSFLKNHGDALAIIISIAGVNLALGVIMISMWISTSERTDLAHLRIDSVQNTFMQFAEQKFNKIEK